MAELWSRGGLGWDELVRRSWKEMWQDEVFGQAARLAFYFFLALIPSLLLFWLVLTKVAQAGIELRDLLSQTLYQILPAQTPSLVSSALKQGGALLGVRGLTLSIAGAFWAAVNGMWAMIAGLNAAYEVEEGRPKWQVLLIAAGLILVWAVLGLIALLMVVFGGQFSSLMGAHAWPILWRVIRAVVAIVVLLVAFAILYRFGPHLEEAELQWSTPGAVAGVALWILSAVLFRIYLQHFNSYDRLYGPLSSVAILLLWLYFSGAAILIGGEVNAVIEHAAAEKGSLKARAPGERRPGEKRRSHRPTA
ncbi:MAG TPA: YihY/virulence factor BrkB family protein [Bryobacteraceae bacterium]|nr:YihY/virulence factor BrkB family protein [Bryobacteraceae bacterium]